MSIEERKSWFKSSQTELEPIGVVDIGSNSVRLVIYEGATRSPAPLFNEKVLCGLGKSVASTGELGDEAVGRALSAMRRFAAIARILQVKYLRAIATAAVREASDGPDFIKRAERALGSRIQVLSGEREAELAAKGIMMGFLDADGIAGDLGGGSLELIDIAKGKLNRATTLPLGGLRLIDTAGNKIDRAYKLAGKSIGEVDWIGEGAGRDFYAVGGTWRSLAKLHMEEDGYPLHVMNNYAIPTSEAKRLCRALRRSQKISEFSRIGVVNRSRRELLPFGAAVLEQLLDRLKPGRVVFSAFGIREGLLFSLLSAAEQRKDPLLSFCADYAQRRSRSIEQAFELTKWTDSIFAKVDHEETADERRLRHAACLISDIGWRAHPDYRSERSLNMIAHGAVGGIDHAGRAFLAMTVYFRHEGAGKHGAQIDGTPGRLASLMSARQVERARILGTAIRAAHMLSVGRPGIIDETPLRLTADLLELRLPKQYADLDGERLRRRFEKLADLLDRRFAVKLAP